jgi:hypothetical protein
MREVSQRRIKSPIDYACSHIRTKEQSRFGGMIFSDVKQGRNIVSVPVQRFHIYWKDEEFRPEITVIVVVVPKKWPISGKKVSEKIPVCHGLLSRNLVGKRFKRNLYRFRFLR